MWDSGENTVSFRLSSACRVLQGVQCDMLLSNRPPGADMTTRKRPRVRMRTRTKASKALLLQDVVM